MLARGLGEALDAVDALVGAPQAVVLVPTREFWPQYADALRAGRARGNLAFDALIAAICRAHGATALLTEDRDFARFPWLRTLRLDDDPSPW